MWTDRIAECCIDETKREMLKDVPLTLIASKEYVPGVWYWLDYFKANLN